MKDKSDESVDAIDSVEATDPVITQKSRISRIWILPLVALLIGIGMIYNDWRNRGVLVQVQFDTAEGLEARKTVVKNRNVPTCHIGDVNVVAIFDQANERAAHADHVVVGVWTKTQARLLFTSSGVILDRVLHPSEHAMGQFLCGTMVTQQLV